MNALIGAIALREEIGERMPVRGADETDVADSGLRLTYVWTQANSSLITGDPPMLATVERMLLDDLVRHYDGDGYDDPADVVGPVVVDKDRAKRIVTTYSNEFHVRADEWPGNAVMLAVGTFVEST